MTIKSRLAKLEKRSEQQGLINKPPSIEIWGTREDGTRYLLDNMEPLKARLRARMDDICDHPEENAAAAVHLQDLMAHPETLS